MSIENIKQKLHTLLMEEVERMRAKGATDDDTKEDAFIEMVSRKVAAENFGNFTEDQYREVWIHFMLTAAPQELRNTAERLRASGAADAAYVLKELADLREQGFPY